MVHWTDEHVDILKSMWKNGDRAFEIAGALKGKFSKNAVIGKAHRLGLAAHQFARVRYGAQPRNGKRANAIPCAQPNWNIRKASAPKPGPVPKSSPVRGKRTTLTIQKDECRWIGGSMHDRVDADTPMCGAPAHDGPYCAEHRAIAWRKAMAL